MKCELHDLRLSFWQVIDLLTGNTVTVRRDNGEVVGAREEPMNDMTQVRTTQKA